MLGTTLVPPWNNVKSDAVTISLTQLTIYTNLHIENGNDPPFCCITWVPQLLIFTKRPGTGEKTYQFLSFLCAGWEWIPPSRTHANRLRMISPEESGT